MWLEKGYVGERYTPTFRQFTQAEAAAAADRSIASQQLGSQWWMNSDYAGPDPSLETKQAFSGAEYAYAWEESFKQNTATGMERNDAAYRAYIDAMSVQQQTISYDPTSQASIIPGIPDILPVGTLPTTTAGIIASEPTPIPLLILVGALVVAAFLLFGR